MDSSGLTQDERVAVARLHALLELLPTALDQHLAPAGLTSFEFTLLEALHESDLHRLRMSALAARTNATLPRLSRVVTSLERKGLVERAPCLEDGRATNAQLTAAGEAAYEASRSLYATAVRRMVLDGLDADGVTQLADLSYSILTKLDPDARLKVTEAGRECAADPSLADSGERDPFCAADPIPSPAEAAEREPAAAV